MDWTYYEFPDFMTKENRFSGDVLPSHYWKQNVRLTFQEDPLGLQRLRDLIGPQTMMWGSDYPHRESTWPKSQEKILETFLGVPEEEKQMIVGGNAAKLYNID
jgi:predicted TIM-barrel fold metal-dependent hydrolase